MDIIIQTVDCTIGQTTMLNRCFNVLVRGLLERVCPLQQTSRGSRSPCSTSNGLCRQAEGRAVKDGNIL